MAVIFCAQLFAQDTETVEISGTVIDKKSNDPIVGVTIVEKGTTNGTVTDIDGKFKLKVSSKEASILISYIGYATIDKKVGEATSFNFSMEEESKNLEEVLITAVAIKKEKKELGYAVQEVKNQEIIDSKETNIVNALNSKVAGVQVVSSSGSPGAAARIRLRGNTSITQNNDPLFVVDGIPVDNTGGERTRDIESSNRAIDINPDDIASMTILKGPAATALYGIRAANGAIIITTKSGQVGKMSVNFSSSFGLDEVNKLPEKQTKYAGGDRLTGGFVPYENRTSKNLSSSWGPSYESIKDVDSLRSYRHYDNPSNFFTYGTQRNNYLSLSGGSEKSTYFLSIGNFKQTGVVPNQDFERTSFKVSNATQVSKYIKLSGSLSYNYSTATRLRKGGNWSAPMIALYRGPSDYDYTGGYTNPLSNEDAYLTLDRQKQKTGSIYDNPFFSVNKNLNTEKINRIIGYYQADFTILPWLTAMARVGTDVYNEVITENYDKRSAENHQLVSFKGSYYEQQRFKQDLNTDAMLNAQKKITKDFELGLRLGHNYFQSNSTRLGVQGYNYLFNDFYDFNGLDKANVPLELIPSSRNNYRALMAAYFDAKVNYRDYLYINFIGRTEQASTLPVNNNTFFYPTINTSLVFSDMLGISNGKVFSFGKLRFAWAQVGNLPNPYLTSNYYEPVITTGFRGQNLYGLAAQSPLGNPNIKPEVSTTQEYGTELKFFNNRLGADITYYHTINSNQIIAADVAPTSGFTSAWVNGGKIRNTGLEVVFNSTPVKRKVQWDLSVNFTRQRTTVIDLVGDFQYVGGGAGFNNGSNAAFVGYQYGVITSPQRLKRYGQDPNDITIRKDLPIVVDSVTGQPVIETAPKGFYIIGNPNPDWFTGIRNSISYKGIYFSMLWDIRKGGDLINLTRGSMSFFGHSKETENREVSAPLENSVYSNGEPNNIPIKKDRTYYDKMGENASVGELWIEDGSWVRLREVTIRYNLPESLIKYAYLKNASLTFTARNLLLFTNYSGVDPETNAAGNDPSLGKDAYNMPNIRSYMMTLNVMF